MSQPSVHKTFALYLRGNFANYTAVSPIIVGLIARGHDGIPKEYLGRDRFVRATEAVPFSESPPSRTHRAPNSDLSDLQYTR
jgi:hypothetical protein